MATVGAGICLLCAASLAGIRTLPDVRHAAHESWRSGTDAMGRTISLAAPPQRIVPIFASNTEILCALGLEDRLVARERLALHPPSIRELPVVGGATGFSVEDIVSRQPDLVVLTPARQAAATLVGPLERLGVATVVLEHPTVESVIENMLFLGHLTGTEDRAMELKEDFQRRLLAVSERRGERPRPTIFLETGALPNGILGTVRKGSYTHDMIELAGGVNVFSDLRGPRQVSLESVRRADPDIILLARRGDVTREIEGRPGWQSLRAVQSGRIYPVSRELLLIPGPRLIEGVEMLADFFNSAPSAETILAKAVEEEM